MTPTTKTPLIFFDSEDTGGSSGPETDETVDYSEYPEEEIDAALSEVESGTETPEMQEQPAETSEGDEPSEPDVEETSEYETEPVDEQEPEKLYAGKYRSPEELEKGYLEHQKLTGRQSQELAELRKFKEEAERLVSPTAQTQTDTEEKTKVEELGLDKEKLEELFYEDPAAAIAYALEQREQHLKHQTQQQEITQREQEAETFNRDLALSRARELLYEDAKARGERNLMDKYADEGYRPVLEEIEANKAVFDQFNAEAEYVIRRFARQEIKLGENVLSPKGKYHPDVFREAFKALNYDKAIENTRIETAETTAQAIKEAKPGAKVLTPTGASKADVKVKWTGNEDAQEAYQKAKNLTDEDLEAVLAELE